MFRKLLASPVSELGIDCWYYYDNSFFNEQTLLCKTVAFASQNKEEKAHG